MTEIDDSKIHDFTKDNLRWGWNGLDFNLTDKTIGHQKADMKGIGRGINKGEFITMNHNDDITCWLVDEISYSHNPKDLFNAKLTLQGVAD